MIDHNIFMKQIRSIVLILNHTGFFLGYFYIFFFWHFGVFFFICENLDFVVLSKQIFDRFNNFLKQILKEQKIYLSQAKKQ